MLKSWSNIEISTLTKTPLILSGMLRNQWLQPAELKELRNRKLRSLIKHSYENVPYYRTLLEAKKITPSDIRTVDDLQKLPILEKKTLRDLPLEQITSRKADLNKTKMFRTSGTTGIPLSIAWDTQMRLIHVLTHIRWMSACGNKITNRIAQIGPIWLPTHELLSRIGFYVTKLVTSSTPLKKQVEELIKFKPDTLLGYPSLIRAIADELREEEIQRITPNMVFTGGEIVHGYTREICRDIFGAQTFDHYGCNEAGDISYECSRHEGYHICSDLVIVEITANNETLPVGEKGEITITNLSNYVCPIIRYSTADIGFLVKDACSCGRSFELMKIARGRRGDIVRLEDGRCVSAIELTGALLFVSGLKQFQIIHKAKDLYTVKVVKGIAFSNKTVEEIRETLRSKLGNVDLDVIIADEIPKEKSGKFRSFIPRDSVFSV